MFFIKMAWFLLYLYIGYVLSLRICIPDSMSYKNSYDRSIPIQICEQLAQAGNYEVEFVDVQNMWEGYTALYSSQCQAAVLDSRFSSGLTSTFPIFYVTFT